MPITVPKKDSSGQTAAQLAEQVGLSQAEVMAQNQDQNPDTMIGGALMAKQNAAKAVPSADVTEVAAEDTPVTQTTETVRQNEASTGTAVTEAATKLSEQSQSAYDKAFSMLDTMVDSAEQDRKDAIANIERQRDISREDTATGQRMETGAISSSLARMGGYLGGSGSNVAYMQSLAQSHRLEVTKLEAAYAEAIEKAKAAYDEKDIALAGQLMNTAKSYEDAINSVRDNALEEAKFAFEVQKYKDLTDSATLDALAQSGKTVDDIPPAYFTAIDAENKWKAGTAKALFEVGVVEKTQTDIENEQTRKANEIDMAIKVVDAMNSIPLGQEVTVGDFTITGLKKGETKEYLEVDVNGYGKGITFNEDTGEWSVKNLGYVGAKEDGWTTEMIGGEPFRFNQRTGEYKAFLGTEADLADMIPEGQYTTFPGKTDSFPGLPLQCGEYTSTLTGTLVGSTLQEKKDNIDIPKESFSDVIPGNTVVFGGSSTGHVAVVLKSYYEPESNRLKFVLTEANREGTGKVEHGREIYADDPRIEGFINSSFKPEYSTGSDAGRLEAAIGRESGTSAVGGSISDTTLQTVARRVSLAMPSKDKSERFETNLAAAYATGDKETIKNEILSGVFMANGMAGRNTVIARNGVINGLNKAKQLIAEYENENGEGSFENEMGFFSGNVEQVLAKFGQSSNPKLRELAVYLQPMKMDYRRSQTGVAFSAKEAAEYNSLFPDTKGSSALQISKIDGLLMAMEDQTESMVRSVIGEDVYDQIFVEEKGDTEISSMEEFNSLPVGSSFMLNGETYTKISDEEYE